MKLKFDELKQAVDHMEKHLGVGGVLSVRHDQQIDAWVLSYVSIDTTNTEIEIYNAAKDVHPTIQERIWLKKRVK